jgi:hypothetical protein
MAGEHGWRLLSRGQTSVAPEQVQPRAATTPDRLSLLEISYALTAGTEARGRGGYAGAPERAGETG